jgi:hypothetical protein
MRPTQWFLLKFLRRWMRVVATKIPDAVVDVKRSADKIVQWSPGCHTEQALKEPGESRSAPGL